MPARKPHAIDEDRPLVLAHAHQPARFRRDCSIFDVRVSPRPISAPLMPDERAIVAHMDAHNGEALALLERAMNMAVAAPRTLLAFARSGELFAAELDALGFTTRWVDGAPFRRTGHLRCGRTPLSSGFFLIGRLDAWVEADGGEGVPAAQDRPSGPRARHHRHEGQRRHHRAGAQGAAGRRSARPHARDGRR